MTIPWWQILACRRRSINMLIAVLACSIVTPSAQAQSQHVNPDGKGNITFTPGLRLQPHYTYDNADDNNDFFVARTRLKASGTVFDNGKYGAEIKIDNVGRFGKETSAQVENAWLDVKVIPDLTIRAGFYDAPFSRNALTSDSKLLLMDRSVIKDALTSLGLADNTIGVLAYGRPSEGRFEYSAGIFDNLQFEQSGGPTARQANSPMSMGRFVLHVFDPTKPGGYADYQSSYIGQGQRLSLGANAGYLPKAREGAVEYDVYCLGADIFYNADAFTFEAEYDRFTENKSPARIGAGWYVQGGYLFHPSIEVAARHQGFDTDTNVSGNEIGWTTVGFNIYLQEHNLKVQTDYTFKREKALEVRNDVFQIQLQLDF